MNCPSCGHPHEDGRLCAHCHPAEGAAFTPLLTDADPSYLTGETALPRRRGFWQPAIAIPAAVLAAGAVALLFAPSSPEPEPAPTLPPTPPPAKAPPIPPGWLSGAEGLAQAEELQATSEAPLVVLFTSDVCAECDRLEKLLQEASVKAFLEGKLKAKLALGGGAAEAAAANRFHLQDVPALFVLPTRASVPARVPLSAIRGPEELVAQLRAELAAGAQELVVGAHRLIASGKHSAALEALAGAVRLDQSNAEAHYWRGVAYAKSNAKEQAVRALERAVELRRDYVEAYDYLGYLLIEQGRLDEAVSRLERLIAARPDYQKGRAYFLRGAAYVRKGEVARAYADAERACELGSEEGCRVKKQRVQEP